MASVFDVANYILSRKVCDNLKLQKFVYYAQAIHLVSNNREKLFDDDIEAWKYGPVVRSLYDKYKANGFDDITQANTESKLSKKEEESVDCMLDFYGDMDAFELVQRTHLEKPWLAAYVPMKNVVISTDAIYEFYKDVFSFE